jgi:hypothetical protein
MNKLFDYDVISINDNKKVLRDKSGKFYSLYRLDNNEYQAYIELLKSKYIKKDIYSYKESIYFNVLFLESINKSEDKAVKNELINVLENIFNEYKYQVTLKKIELKKLNNLYKLLDNKFNYIEMRIREVEFKQVKDDLSWIILSKYHSILDAKIILYDLQTDIFRFIDKETVIDYGLIFNGMEKVILENNQIEPKFSFFYAPKGMLYARYYLLCDHYGVSEEFKKKVSKLSVFDKKFFCFMVIYIYILNLNIGIIINNSNVNLYVDICKKIDAFIREFKSLLK